MFTHFDILAKINTGEIGIKIKQVEAMRYKIPIRHESKMAVGSLSNGHIENVIIRVYTNEGIDGVGESSPWSVVTSETSEIVKIVVERYLRSVVVGEDPFDVEKICRKMDKAIHGNSSAKAGIEMAIYDIIGKTLRIPVFKILGGVFQAKIPLSFSVASQEVKADVEKIRELVDKGVRNFKIKVGVLNPDEDIQRVAAIREAFDDKIDLRVDVNQGWSRDIALKTIKKLERFDITYVEQPLPYWDIDGMARIAKAVETPISADESAFTIHDVIRIINKKAADIISIKLMKFGGISKSKKAAAIAEAAGISCYAGAMWESEIGVAAALHVSGSSPSIVYGSDYYIPIFLMTDSITQKALKYENGYMYLPTEPGLGVALDEEKIQRYMVKRL